MTAWQTERLGALDRDQRAAIAAFPDEFAVILPQRADASIYRSLERLRIVETRAAQDGALLAALTTYGMQLWLWLDRKRRDREFLDGLPQKRN